MTARGSRVALLILLGVALMVAGCSSGGGGGGGGGAAAAGELESDGTAYGCAGPPPGTTGARRLPRSELLPVTAVPRRIREAERAVAVDLSGSVPTPCNQGVLNSCTAWAGAYGLMTYLAAVNIDDWTDLDRTDRHFSPTFVFNLSNAFLMGVSSADTCLEAGSIVEDVLTLLRDTGSVVWADLPYTADDCETKPSAGLMAAAGDFHVAYFNWVAADDVVEVKSHLSTGVPVMVNLRVGESFANLVGGEVLGSAEVGETGLHTVLVVGYDDDLDGVGVVKVMNSWGTSWGDGGFGFISYTAWPGFVDQGWVVGRDLISPYGGVQPGVGIGGCAFNPLRDSDGDGYSDSVEIEFADYGFDPAVPEEVFNPDYVERPDADADGWPDETEEVFGTDPEDPDDFVFGCDYEYPADLVAEMLAASALEIPISLLPGLGVVPGEAILNGLPDFGVDPAGGGAFEGAAVTVRLVNNTTSDVEVEVRALDGLPGDPDEVLLITVEPLLGGTEVLTGGDRDAYLLFLIGWGSSYNVPAAGRVESTLTCGADTVLGTRQFDALTADGAVRVPAVHVLFAGVDFNCGDVIEFHYAESDASATGFVSDWSVVTGG